MARLLRPVTPSFEGSNPMTISARLPVEGETGPLEGKRAFSILAIVGRLHITVIAALGVFTFGWLFTGEYPWLLTAVCALDWYLVNLINRTVDLKEDRANVITGTEFAAKNRRMILGLASTILIVSLVTVHFLNPAITLLRITYHLLGAFYNWAILPGGRRLKELYFWKNGASALGFIITVFAYPLATAGSEKGPIVFPLGITWTGVFFSGLFFILFIMSYEVIYDLRDVKGDALAGIRTYPVVHGERIAIRMVDGFIFSSMAVLAIGYLFAFIPWRIFIMICAPALQFAVYKRALRRGIRPKDCIGLTWMGAAMLFIYHLWVIADLPGAGS
jgi:4-hydroxybenzoate polyprenyltransferase